MIIEDVKQELIGQGKDPNDFNITITENGYLVSPKWFYENKQIAKKEDKPIIDDINEVAVISTYTMEDTISIAETLALALLKIDELQAEIETLKGSAV